MTAPTERQLGFWMCTALVVGNMIGASVFMMPASLAPYGLHSSIAGWLVTASGALFLAGVFAALGRAFPSACGPYDYTRIAFGELAGFVVAWGYWISIWVSNAAIATGFTSYLSDLVPALGTPPVSVVVIIAVVWFLTGVNAWGTRTAGSLQLLTTALKIIPLVAVAALGVYLLLVRDPTMLAPLQQPLSWSGETVTAAAALTLFSFLGLESATIPAGKVQDPARTIPRATLLGTLATTVIYLLACTTVMILLSPDELAASHAPFADVARRFWGGGVGAWIALFAMVSAFGALNGWILLQGELPFHMARQGTFPRIFARESRRHTPAASLYIGSALTTVLVLMNSAKSMVDIFSFMVLLGTASTLIMYLLCAFAVLKLLRRGELPAAGPHVRWLAFVSIVSAVFSVWAIFGAGLSTDPAACGQQHLVCWAPWLANPAILSVLLTASGVPVFYLMRRDKVSGAATA
jgi:APA family basic amino acid/polyamine antiporter